MMKFKRYYAAAIQTDFPACQNRDEIESRVDRMLEMATQTVEGYAPFHDIRLLVFPEFAHTPPVYTTPEELHRHLAVELPNTHTDRYVAFCRQYQVYMQTGTFLERDDKYPGAVFNTTLLIGPEGILSKYRKVNTWIPWEVHASPADIVDYEEPLFPVVDTDIGRLGVAICYDWLFPETIREIRQQQADIAIRVSAYMDPWGATEPMDWWTLFNRARAAENMLYVVAANQGAQMRNYPPFSWPGGSMVVDYDGRILAQADPGPGEKVVVAPVDIEALRYERERREGHDTIAHQRDAYRYHKESGLPEDGNLTPQIEDLRARINRANKNT